MQEIEVDRRPESRRIQHTNVWKDIEVSTSPEWRRDQNNRGLEGGLTPRAMPGYLRAT